MTLEHQFTVLSDFLMADAHGRLTIAGTFTNVNLVSLPSKMPRFCAAVGFRAAEGDTFRVSLVAPDGAELRELGAGTIDNLPKTDRLTMGIVTSEIVGLEFDQTGVFQVVLWDGDGNAVHRREFGAFLIAPEEAGDEPRID